MRALIADDHPLYLDAARTQLERHFPGVEIASGRSLPDALARIEEAGRFDIVLLDYTMPGMNGVAGLREVIAASGAPVVVMSGTASQAEVGACIAAGAKGFLPKTLDAPVFTAAVNMILLGGTFLPAEFAAAVPAPPPPISPAAAESGLRDLSAREMEVLALLTDGASNKEIARRLEIQEVTVKLHATRIFTKLGVRNRSQAAVKAIEGKLIRR